MLGIDIGTKSLKVAQSTRAGRVDSIASYTYQEPLRGEDLKPLKSDLAAFVDENRYKGEAVWSSIGSAFAKIHVEDFPQMSADELKGAVELQAEDYAASNWNEIDVDYTVIEEKPESEQVRVLFVVSSRQLTQDYISVFRECSLYPIGLTVDALAVVTSFRHALPIAQRNSQWTILLDMGAIMSNINIVNGEQIELVRNVAFGTQAIEETMTESSGREMTGGIEPIGDSLETVAEPLLTELRRTIEYYQRRLRQQNPEEDSENYEFYMCGGGSSLPELCSLIENKLGREVQFFDPFGAVKTTCDLPPSQDERSIYAVALGNILTGLPPD